jgi:hypothetical protein
MEEIKSELKPIDFDRIVIELQKGTESLRSISVSRQDLKTLKEGHGKETSDVINEVVALLMDPNALPTPEEPIDKA